MKKRFIDLFRGYYVSPIYDISGNGDSYVEFIETDYITNNGLLDIDYKLSYDGGGTWTDWKNINNSPLLHFFDNTQPFTNLLFQYRVVMGRGTNGVTPIFRKFKLSLIEGHTIDNVGDLICKPEFWIKKTVSAGDVIIKNETNGMVMELKNLNRDETVYINCENEDIVSDLPLTYRYKDFNNMFMELELGENIISAYGDCEIDMRYQFKILQG